MRGERVVDDSFLLVFNADHAEVTFTLPPRRYGAKWSYVIDTFNVGVAGRRPLGAGATVDVPPHTLHVLQRV
jgi:glycogen operon protein